jgi:hypothetical protein
LSKKAEEILERNAWEIRISNQAYNRLLKQLAREMKLDRKVKGKPLYEHISSHIGRKTFISLSIKQKIPLPIVMKMAGINNYETIKKYISIDVDDLFGSMEWF